MLYEGGSHLVTVLLAAVLRDLPAEFAAAAFENTILRR